MGFITDAMAGGPEDPSLVQPEDDPPIPLFSPTAASEPYPIDALGGVVAEAAAAICRKVQVPAAIAAQSVLATASLAAQAHANVLLPYGQERALSLYLVTIAASGDRKSTADNEALWPIRKREQTLAQEYKQDHAIWSIEHAAWMAEKRKIEGKTGLGLDGRKKALAELGPQPAGPLHPFLTATDPTVEGLAKAWISSQASLGIFTAEGGQLIGGYGMSLDNRLKTAAAFSQIWDGQPIKRVRAMDGVTILHGRRLAMHIMVQPAAASTLLSDPLLRDQGFLSRPLVAAPESIAGTRLYRTTAAEDDNSIRAYGARILSVLETDWPLVEGHLNELRPRALNLCEAAVREWIRFHDHVERQCAPGSDLAVIRDFAAKAGEHAARIAGTLTIIKDIGAAVVDAGAMESALILVDWYLNESLRLHSAPGVDPVLRRAQSLLDWKTAQPGEEVSFRDIQQRGPAQVRAKLLTDEAVDVLKAHRWIEEIDTRPRRFRRRTA